jgi:3-oxoacyl-[acyl-carrier protein] reductase
MSANSRLQQLTAHLGKGLTGALLEGQVAIITGSGQGIGKAAALLFAAHGAHVVVSDLDVQKSNDTAKEITESGGSAIAVPGNVMDPKFGENVVKETVAKFGKVRGSAAGQQAVHRCSEYAPHSVARWLRIV